MYERNIFLFYLLGAFHALIFCFSVIHVLFLQSIGFSFTQITVLFATWALTFVIAEVFTGIFADIHGRKTSIMICSFFRVAAVSMYIFFPFYHAIFLALIFFALGASFSSGAMDSLLFESLKKLKRENEYKKILSRKQFLFVSLSILTTFGAPFLFENARQIPFYVAEVFAALYVFAVLFLHDPFKRSHSVSYLRGAKAQFKKSFTVIRHDRFLTWLIFFAAVFGLSIGFFSDSLNQPFIKETRSLFEYSVVFTLATIIQSVLLLKLDTIFGFLERYNIYWFFVLAVPSLLALLLIPSTPLAILVLGLLWTVGSIRGIFFSNEINLCVKNDDERATVHSMASLIDASLYMLSALILGRMLDILSLTQSLIVLVAISLVLPLIVLCFRPNTI